MASFPGASTKPSPSAAAPPPAVRSAPPGWRDPRLWIGVLLVAASVVAGARLFSAADDSVSVWAAATDLAAGGRLESDDLVLARVRFTDPEALAGYLSVQDQLPADPTLLRAVGAGELVPRAALGSASGDQVLEVPVAVDPEQVPGAVHAGSVVDLYLVAAAGPRGGRPPEEGPALSGVTVSDAPPLSDSFSATGKRQLVLAMDEAEAARFFQLLATRESPQLTVVLRE